MFCHHDADVVPMLEMRSEMSSPFPAIPMWSVRTSWSDVLLRAIERGSVGATRSQASRDVTFPTSSQPSPSIVAENFWVSLLIVERLAGMPLTDSRQLT